MRYQGNARRLILALKHGDRPDLARATAPWLARAARPLLTQNTVIVPIPIHWTRLLRRRYNQSCELSRALAKELGIAHAPQALVRPKHTRPHEGMSVEERFANMQNALIAHPQKSHVLAGKNVLLLDDVMTSGATFDAATRACLTAGSQTVQVLTLARASRDA
jgi:ComF family protein